MEWLIIKTLYLPTSKRYALLLQAEEVRLVAEVSAPSLYPGDILSPVKDALYTINNDAERELKVLSAVKYSPAYWGILSSLSASRQTAKMCILS